MSRVELPYPPSLNERMAVVRGRMVKTAAARRYAEQAGQLALLAGVRPIGGPVVVSVCVYRPRRSGDLDNCLKGILDALTGIAYDDDSQVAEIHAYRLDDAARPRVSVEVTAQTPLDGQRPGLQPGDGTGFDLRGLATPPERPSARQPGSQGPSKRLPDGAKRDKP